MYILGLTSQEKPQVQPWGDKYVHVPLNVKEFIQTDEEGNEVTGFMYNCIECVELPLTSDKIVNAVCKEHFADDMEYIMANIHKTNDKKVKSYMAFVEEINAQCEKLGY